MPPISVQLADGGSLQIDVRTSSRARRLRLVSSIKGIEAVVPENCAPEALSGFVESKRDWLSKTSRYFARVREKCGGHELGTIYFLGSKYKVNVVRDEHPSTIVSEALKVITFHVVDKRKLTIHQQKWYREQTASILEERLPTIAAKLGLRYNKVSIKNQRSRWASCSSKGNLNFSLLLSAAPPEVVDYVIIHELFHLKELDHSTRFWQLVSGADPDFKKHKEWLSSHAPVIRIE